MLKRIRHLRALALALLAGLVGGGGAAPAQQAAQDRAAYLRRHYQKAEYMVPMRDGVRLFTAVYTPSDTSRSYPILMRRTPYSCQPYGTDRFPGSLGPSRLFVSDGYIFVEQDVRGRFMSEGRFVNMRPHRDRKRGPQQIDESSDTYDTIAWLLAHVANHNGRVGLWGISYPGFYAAAGMIDAHPALKAVSPQAPIADWFFDDFHHHGAFFLPDAFNFFAAFGQPRPEPTRRWPPRFRHGTPDGYRFFLELGPLGNVNARYFKRQIDFWNKLVEHPNYDAFWQARNILPHLHQVAPAVMVVGGWFDAEDLYGPLKIYRAIERQNPQAFNVLVMGPWAHGGWGRSEGDRLGDIRFGSKTSLFYREHIELPFFNHFLKDAAEPDLPEACVFETGANRWRRFAHWPPAALAPAELYLHEDGRLSFDPPEAAEQPFDEYLSDPAKPVPFTRAISTAVPKWYMTEDQRFAARRPDVLTYQTEPLDDALTLAGPLEADLWVSTSGSASDWVVKLIDVFPPDEPDPPRLPRGQHLGEYQMLLRSEVIRGRFRNSYQRPEPFVPGRPTRVRLELLDVLHTFAPGHRIMVQVQSTWFPMVDRNPQKYVDNIFLADEQDFIKTTQRVYHTPARASRLRLGVLPADRGKGLPRVRREKGLSHQQQHEQQPRRAGDGPARLELEANTGGVWSAAASALQLPARRSYPRATARAPQLAARESPRAAATRAP